MKKQRQKLFFQELIAFVILFTVLGLVIYLFFQNSVYHNINKGLDEQESQILSNRNPKPLNEKPEFADPHPKAPVGTGPFHFNFIIFNPQGEIINAEMLGERNYTFLSKIKLNKNQINQKANLTLSSENENINFRTLLIKVPLNNKNPRYAGNYILVLENIDAELLTITSFQRSLIITIIIFTILAITTSYWLSHFNMRPIIDAWKKQRDFSANAAHELKTPLAIIQNQLEFLLMKPHSTIRKEASKVTTALSEVTRLKKITTRLLFLARSDAGIIQIQKSSFAFDSWLTTVIKPYQEIAQSQNKILVTDLNFPGLVRIDHDLFHQLLVILIDNALKYTSSGEQIKIKSRKNKNNLVLEIQDSGQGIPNQDKVHIFERFYRADHAHNFKTGGSGLGLAIAQWIVQQHHGKIIVTDNLPQGTIFRIKIPI